MKFEDLYFVTGTDTGVGKTVLTTLLIRCCHEADLLIRAVKPFCSGGRADARLLQATQPNIIMDQINPWFFRAPLAPLLAARQEGVHVSLAETLSFLKAARPPGGLLLVEGAGGLLSPLGQGFSNREIIRALRAVPIVVCANRLGAVNQARLVVEALPKSLACQARIVMVQPARPNSASRSNIRLLRECLSRNPIIELPWFGSNVDPIRLRLTPALRRSLLGLL